jgi:hypothetical protein
MTKLTFYVGQTRPDGRLFNAASKEWDLIQFALMEGYGGYSLSPVLGGWKDPVSGEKVIEATVVVTVLTDEPEDPVKVVRFAQLMKERFQQKAVLYTVETIKGEFV